MSQFRNSISRILRNHQINRWRGVAKHLQWQGRKVFNGFPFVQRLSESRLIAAHPQCGVSALINSHGLYDYNNMLFLQSLLGQGGTFIDIGANIGSYTLIASENALARIHAFEPHPNTFKLLQKNIELNSRTNVILHNTALGLSEGTVRMTDQSCSSVNHIVPAEAKLEGAIAVPCRRMDEICQIYGLTPQVVKLDVEGFEYDVLQGFGALLSSIEVLMIEMNGLSDERSHGQKEIHSLLKGAGLTGPWKCRFDQRELVPLQGRSGEDSLYINTAFYQKMTAMGLRFVEQD